MTKEGKFNSPIKKNLKKEIIDFAMILKIIKIQRNFKKYSESKKKIRMSFNENIVNKMI